LDRLVTVPCLLPEIRDWVLRLGAETLSTGLDPQETPKKYFVIETPT